MSSQATNNVHNIYGHGYHMDKMACCLDEHEAPIMRLQELNNLQYIESHDENARLCHPPQKRAVPVLIGPWQEPLEQERAGVMWKDKP